MTHIWRWIALAVAVVMVLGVSGVACGRLGPDAAAAKLDQALKTAVDDDPAVHGAVMWVDAPRLGVTQGWAHGLANLDAGTPMTVHTPFLSASVGKLAVAAAVMRLVADGRLSLDDPLSKWVPASRFAGLPVQGGDEVLGRVTIRQLVAHRSGLPDYFSDASRDGAPRLFDLIAVEPDRTWSRDAMLDYARAHYAPAGAPGDFHYADTNYDLLGLVLEGVTTQPFHRVVREQVLEPLGMTRTWYHAFEPAPPGLAQVADVFVGDVNLGGAPSLSADQAGGGLATTVEDLRLLLRGLQAGRPVPMEVLASDFTENAMHTGIDVGLCAWRIRPRGVFFALTGLPELVGHSGATGVWAYVARDLDAVFVGAVSQSHWQEKHVKFLLAEVLPTVSRIDSSQIERKQ